MRLSRPPCVAAACGVALLLLLGLMLNGPAAAARSTIASLGPEDFGRPAAVSAAAASVTFSPTVVPQGGTLSVSGSGSSTGTVTATVRLVAAEPPMTTVATLGTAPLSAGSFGPLTFTISGATPAGIYRVQATDGLVTATSASTLAVTAVAPHMAFTTQPFRAAHGFALGLQPAVVIQDVSGSILTGDNTTVVTLAIKGGTGTSGVTLACDQTAGGVTTMTVAAGVATFTGCRIDQPGAGYVLEATAAGLTSGHTVPFNVTWAGDANGDCRVSVMDYSLVVTHFGKTSSSPDWTDQTTQPWRADMNGDERVSVVDYSIVVTRFGTSTASCPAPTTTTIAIGFVEPAARALVGDSVAVAAVVASRYQVQSVRARVAGREAALAFVIGAGICGRYYEACWTGTVSLAGLVRGEYEVVVTATDVFGGRAQARSTVRRDLPPTLTVLAPLADSVVRPQVQVTALCADDDPAGCTAIRLTISGVVLATGQSSLSTTISLAAYERQFVTLLFVAEDSAGQRRSEGRTVFVESSTGLRHVESVGGPIWDVQPDRMLFVEDVGGTNVLKVRERSSGQETSVISDTTQTLEYGFLTPRGVIFVVRARGFPMDWTLYEWRDGVLVNHGYPNSPTSLKVKGNYAIWNVWRRSELMTPLIRRDLVAGTNVEISPNAGNWFNDVAENGDVAYWDYSYNVFRYRNGVTTRLSSASNLWNTYALTDGVNVVYRRHTPCCSNQTYALVLYGPQGEVILAPARSQEPASGYDYQVNNGWIAVTRLGTAGELQVWLRSPVGQETQVSYFGSSSRIEALAPNGQVIFVNAGRRYLAGPGMAPVDMSAVFMGRSFWQNGQWLVVIGRSLFQVVP